MGKNKLKRFKENETFSHVIQPDFLTLENNKFELKGRWNSDFFKNDKPIVLELGCGKGEYTVGLAKLNPNINTIGIDIKGARLWRGAKESFEAKMKNVAFLRIRVDFIRSCFAENEVAEIWCTFSDPQRGRRRSIKKRLTSSVFLTHYQHLLKHNGKVHLKTDDPVLYAYTQDVIKINNLKVLHDIPNIYESDYSHIVPHIETHYEKIWRDKGRNITYICFELPNDVKLIEPPINEEREGFI